MGVSSFGPYFHRNKATGKTADDLQIVVDVSNTTNYPHQSASGVQLLRIKFRVKGTAGSAGDAQLKIGIVEENDATNGTMAIIAESDVIAYNEEYESGWQDYGHGGIDLHVVSGRLVSADAPVSGDITLLKNDQGDLVDAVRGTTKSAGAGDLVVFLDEGTNGGTYEYEVLAKWREA